MEYLVPARLWEKPEHRLFKKFCECVNDSQFHYLITCDINYFEPDERARIVQLGRRFASGTTDQGTQTTTNSPTEDVNQFNGKSRRLNVDLISGEDGPILSTDQPGDSIVELTSGEDDPVKSIIQARQRRRQRPLITSDDDSVDEQGLKQESPLAQRAKRRKHHIAKDEGESQSKKTYPSQQNWGPIVQLGGLAEPDEALKEFLYGSVDDKATEFLSKHNHLTVDKFETHCEEVFRMSMRKNPIDSVYRLLLLLGIYDRACNLYSPKEFDAWKDRRHGKVASNLDFVCKTLGPGNIFWLYREFSNSFLQKVTKSGESYLAAMAKLTELGLKEKIKKTIANEVVNAIRKRLNNIAHQDGQGPGIRGNARPGAQRNGGPGTRGNASPAA
ncbi:MAG: hypothetical protein Q9204_008900 [Flavoplaca sp. TL-2023a]